MEKYERVEKPRPEVPIMDNEIRIASLGWPRKYITNAITLLGDRGVSTVVLKAMGNAISKAVKVAEVIKRRIPNLHQNTTIGSAAVSYTREPVKEGLLPLETMRHVSIITITLSTTQLDTSSTGYQPPLPVDQVKPMLEYENEGEDSQFVSGKARARGRGTGRGVISVSQAQPQYVNGSLNDNGRGGHRRGSFGHVGNYSENGFGRGQGRGEGRNGGNGEDGWQVVSRARGRGMGRARARGGRN
ncbi:hypothetical protein SUGI_0546360 [Cryptomeria japonica]|uniref:uncharacterized protein LOC131032813 n=1 Tax=Cryptomeria japonica TaxID=3369 RepID=UPI002408A704|nr:uncharacterized protein LOC131032813 [Cryptomeria japonica]GLJ27840.1 hypothetical protein SUGI_0546360 [Cryptomeria japonica]